MIESNIYLPFTRLGTITVVGDRRFKKGTWMRLVETGEIYYIDGVTQNYSISKSSVNRTTTLNLSRGIVESNWEQYFKIATLDLNIEFIENSKSPYEEYIKSVPRWGFRTKPYKLDRAT